MDAQTFRNFKPEVLPPTLDVITSGYNEDLAPVFPAGGTVDRPVVGDWDHAYHNCTDNTIRWTHNHLDEIPPSP